MEGRKAIDLGLDQALFQAVQQNAFYIVDSLLKAGANPDGYIGENDFRCIHWAVKNRNAHIVALLLDAGADIFSICKDQKLQSTPITMASDKYGSLGWYIVKMIAKRWNDNQSEYRGHRVALIRAIYFGHSESLRFLLEAGTRVNFKCQDIKIQNEKIKSFSSFSPLHLAVDRNDPAIIKELLKFSADPSIKNDRGQTPAEMAAELGYWYCVEALARYDFQFTGKAIYEKLRTVSCDRDEFGKWAPYKEAVFAYILQIKDKQQRVYDLEIAKDINYCLGYLFWYKRGVKSPSLETGMLKRIIDQLKIESMSKESLETLRSTTAQVMSSIQTQTPSAQPVEARYYPDLTAIPKLTPIYDPTLTRQLMALPRVDELPTLPVRKEEKAEKKVKAFGF